MHGVFLLISLAGLQASIRLFHACALGFSSGLLDPGLAWNASVWEWSALAAMHFMFERLSAALRRCPRASHPHTWRAGGFGRVLTARPSLLLMHRFGFVCSDGHS